MPFPSTLLAHIVVSPLAQTALATRPDNWIFGQAPQGAMLVLVKVVVIVATMGGICLLLRLLYGPGGPLRPKEFGTGHIAERRECKARLRELKRRRKAGELTKVQYLEQRWEILRKP